MEKISGSCLCGTVSFEIENNFENFQLCHCVQCQKTTGTAHASNLFTDPKYMTWHTGQDSIHRFDVEGRRISNCFCQNCGSRVPAGSLDGNPAISPQANIFWPERAQWYDQAVQAEHYETYIESDIK